MTRTIYFLTSLILLSLAFQANAYLPKADLIKGSGPEVYLLELGTKHWIPDIKTFNDFKYSWSNIKSVSDSVLNSYPTGEDLNRYYDYPDGSLIRGSGQKVYLIELGKKRWIPSPQIFTGNNFGWKYIIRVDDDD
ncbi:MAG: hypothetical protein ABH889_01300, partial [Candidatus Portnoybacteria bacterium]